MKEVLYTIPLTDAFQAKDECPFCYAEREIEQDLLDLVLGSGSSYMESDMREMTDKAGFCRQHFKKMFDYGNTLGNGWILKTHYVQIQKEFDKQVKMFAPTKVGLLNKVKGESGGNSMSQWVEAKNKSCYICEEYQKIYDRYIDTFFYMYKKDNDLKNMMADSNGFCLTHFGDLCAKADLALNDNQKKEFYPFLFDLMQKNLARLSEDVSWLVEKFDYRNKDKDWKNSKDAIQRGMQKLKGGYPNDAPYKQSK